MTVAAILMVKDEGDVIEHTIRHLATQVDEIIVSDNGSIDGTREILDRLQDDPPLGIDFTLADDPDLGYWQSAKMTRLAAAARDLGHDWVLPVDADEHWVTEPQERPIRDHLLSLPPDVTVCRARLFHYIPTAQDPPVSEVPSPFARIGWRLTEPSSLGKVAARLVPGLVIEAGNHGVTVKGARPALMGGGLRVNHFSWRSSDQYARKIRNGARAYAATDLPEEVGPHWRMWGDPDAPDLEESAAAHFRKYFWAPAPPCAPQSSDPRGLTFDPAVAL